MPKFINFKNGEHGVLIRGVKQYFSIHRWYVAQKTRASLGLKMNIAGNCITDTCTRTPAAYEYQALHMTYFPLTFSAAKMGRLPYGPGNAHILQSKGADVGVMKFYCTEYSTHCGQEGFIPRSGHHSGTGYQSNFRPGVCYSRRLDELDNPAMG